MAHASVPRIPVERFELSCGAKLLVSPRAGAPVCAVQAHLRGGHSLDPPGRAGTANLAGRLVDRGTRKHDEDQLLAALETGAGGLNGGSIGVTGTIENRHWKTLLEVLSEVLVEPTYPRELVELERRRVLERLAVERDDPRAQAARMFRELVYGEHWLGRSEQGELESVARISRADLTGFHRKNWVARRAVLAFCGDVEPKAVYRFLERRLREWRSGKPLPPPNRDFPAPAARTSVFRADRQQVHVYLGHLGITRRDPDFPALVVMDHVLGTGPGFTSRIARKLRDEQGLAYSVHAAIHSSAGVLPGTFTAYIGTSPDHLATAVQGFLREMRAIREEPVTAEELELVRSYLTGAYALGFERASRRTQYLVSTERNGLPDGHLAALVERFAEVTAEDVQAAARRHLLPEAACVVAAGPVTKRDLEQALAPPRARRGQRPRTKHRRARV